MFFIALSIPEYYTTLASKVLKFLQIVKGKFMLKCFKMMGSIWTSVRSMFRWPPDGSAH